LFRCAGPPGVQLAPVQCVGSDAVIATWFYLPKPVCCGSGDGECATDESNSMGATGGQLPAWVLGATHQRWFCLGQFSPKWDANKRDARSRAHSQRSCCRGSNFNDHSPHQTPVEALDGAHQLFQEATQLLQEEGGGHTSRWRKSRSDRVGVMTSWKPLQPLQTQNCHHHTRDDEGKRTGVWRNRAIL